jgi:hypothetical protein
MATEFTPSSALARSRPILLSLVGFAAAYSIYLAVTTQSTAPITPNTLHRSNAVHRPRRRERAQTITEHLQGDGQPEQGGGEQMETQEHQAPSQAGEPQVPAAVAHAFLGMTNDYGYFNTENATGVAAQFPLVPRYMMPLNRFAISLGLSEEAARTEFNRYQARFVQRFLDDQYRPGRHALDLHDDVELPALCNWMHMGGIMVMNFTAGVANHVASRTQVHDAELSLSGTEVESQQIREDSDGQNLKQLLCK